MRSAIHMRGGEGSKGLSICMRRAGSIAMVWVAVAGLGGCVPPSGGNTSPNLLSLSHKSRDGLQAGLNYPHNPVVRVAAIEACQRLSLTESLPWIRIALRDDEPAVRFAACMALGDLKDRSSESSIRPLLNDRDPGVRIAAIYALHQLGDSDRTGQLTYYLFDHLDPAVRRQAAFALGRMSSDGVVKILARAMSDKDEGVQFNALEGMARHGVKEALNQLQVMANSGVGSEETVAIAALAELEDPSLTEIFLYKLDSAQHIETKLAAAAGLGRLGNLEGYNLAFSSLDFRAARRDEPNDPPEDQIMRVRLLAASALGAYGREEALNPLERMLINGDDPRLQVAAAQAILEIVQSVRERTSPFGRKRRS